MFPVTSRYHDVEVTKLETASSTSSVQADSSLIVYLRRRFLPQTTNVTVLAEHLVTQGERLDTITARYLGDPEQFWRLCDANAAMNPDELEKIGRRLQIPLIQGGG